MSRDLPSGVGPKGHRGRLVAINELPGYQRLLAAGGRFLVDL